MSASVDTSKRTWLIASSCAGAVGAGFAAVPFVSSFSPSERAKGIDGQLADPKSERKPDELTPAYAKNEARSIKPEIFVAVGICSHLGCSPIDKFTPGAQPSLSSDWTGGFLCPCHGSTFDLAGRVYKNKPAPDNLEIPPHMYLSDSRLIIGEDKKA
jgi:ubiquinol-cytochrome c reductase iron-sulfur subunit